MTRRAANSDGDGPRRGDRAGRATAVYVVAKSMPVPATATMASHVGRRIVKSTLSGANGSLTPIVPVSSSPATSPAVPAVGGSQRRMNRKTIAVKRPPPSPTNRRNPIVPSRVISPTRSPASVSRPCVDRPEVAASRRITNRPPSPSTSSPEIKPAQTMAPSVVVASDIVARDPMRSRRVAISGSRRHRQLMYAAMAMADTPSPDTTRFPALMPRQTSDSSSWATTRARLISGPLL